MSIRSEFSPLVKLAWPLLIAQVTQTLMGVVDTIMAGRVSATDMAAVAVASGFVFPILFFIQGITLALPPIISRLNGAGDVSNIANATQQLGWLALAVSVPFSIASFFLDDIFQHAPIEPELRQITLNYMGNLLVFAPIFAIYQVGRNYCEGLSDTRPSMVIMGIGMIINIPANYIFIYGKLGVPAMGGAGCAVATGIVFTVMAVSTVIYSFRAKHFQPYKLYAQVYKPNFTDIKTSFKIGFPIAMTILFEVSLFAAIAILLAPFGAKIVASHQIALNFSALMFMIPMSIGMATSIRVSYLLGKSPDQAPVAIKSALILGLSLATLTAVMTFLLRFKIGSLYSNEMDVINMAASLMLLAAFFQFSDAIQVITANALRGYKDTRAMLVITFFAYWVIGLSCGVILGTSDYIVPQLGARGFWIGLIAGLTAAAIMLSLRLRYIQTHETWKQHE